MRAVKGFSIKKKKVWHEAGLHWKKNPKRWMSDRRKFRDEKSMIKKKLSIKQQPHEWKQTLSVHSGQS